MRSFVAILAFTCVFGCASPKPEDGAKPPIPGQVSQNSGPSRADYAAGSTSSVAPAGTPAAGGMTPMSGTDSVTGAGMGGLGQSAKNSAKKAAASTATSGSTGTTQENGEQ